MITMVTMGTMDTMEPFFSQTLRSGIVTIVPIVSIVDIRRTCGFYCILSG